MDKCFFLIVTDGESEIFHNELYASNFHDILHGLHCSHSNSVTYLIVPNYKILTQLRDDFPSIVYILLNVDKDLETNKEIFTTLPEMDCIIDFTGELDSKTLGWIPELQFKEKFSWKIKHATFSKLNDQLNGKEEEVLPALITIIPTKEETNAVKAIAKRVKNKGAAALKPLHTKQTPPIKFYPSRKFLYLRNSAEPVVAGPSSSGMASISSSLTATGRLLSRMEERKRLRGPTTTSKSNTNTSNYNSGERQPLLQGGHTSSSPATATDSISESNFMTTFSEFISWTWSNCCCCLASCDPDHSTHILPEFQNDAHLLSHVRAEHHKYLVAKLIFQGAEGMWLRILKNIESDQKVEAEAVRAKYRGKKQEGMDKYHKVVAQNKENPQTMDILIKAKAQRAQTELEKVKWVDRDLANELERLKIKCDNFKDNEGEGEFYKELMSMQMTVLRHAKSKYVQLEDDLYQQFGSNWA